MRAAWALPLLLLLLAGPAAAQRAAIELAVDEAVQESKPQRIIAYDVQVRNVGAERTEVRFEVLSEPDGFQVIVPEPVALDPATSATVSVMVATPFKNGYNQDEGSVAIRATPFTADGVAGEPVEARLLAKVKGWYVPEPGFAVALAALVAALLARRARQPR